MGIFNIAITFLGYSWIPPQETWFYGNVTSCNGKSNDLHSAHWSNSVPGHWFPLCCRLIRGLLELSVSQSPSKRATIKKRCINMYWDRTEKNREVMNKSKTSESVFSIHPRTIHIYTIFKQIRLCSDFIDSNGTQIGSLQYCGAIGPKASALSSLVCIICAQLPGRMHSLIRASTATDPSPYLPIAAPSPITHWTTDPQGWSMLACAHPDTHITTRVFPQGHFCSTLL